MGSKPEEGNGEGRKRSVATGTLLEVNSFIIANRMSQKNPGIGPATKTETGVASHSSASNSGATPQTTKPRVDNDSDWSDVSSVASQKQRKNRKHNNKTHRNRSNSTASQDLSCFDVKIDPSIQKIRDGVAQGKPLKSVLNAHKKEKLKAETAASGGAQNQQSKAGATANDLSHKPNRLATVGATNKIPTQAQTAASGIQQRPSQANGQGLGTSNLSNSQTGKVPNVGKQGRGTGKGNTKSASTNTEVEIMPVIFEEDENFLGKIQRQGQTNNAYAKRSPKDEDYLLRIGVIEQTNTSFDSSNPPSLVWLRKGRERRTTPEIEGEDALLISWFSEAQEQVSMPAGEDEGDYILHIGALEQTNTAYCPKVPNVEEQYLFSIGILEQTNNCYQPQDHFPKPTREQHLMLKMGLTTRKELFSKKSVNVTADKIEAPKQKQESTTWSGFLRFRSYFKREGPPTDPNKIIRQPAWYHRIIPGFKRHQSEFDFNKPINHRIGMLSKSKETKAGKVSGVIIPDDKIIPSLFYELRIKQNAVYPDRKLRLEHTLKLAHKWLEVEKSVRQERGEPFVTDTPAFVNSFQLTVQKAVDQSDSAFMYAEENQNVSREKGFRLAHLRETLIKRFH